MTGKLQEPSSLMTTLRLVCLLMMYHYTCYTDIKSLETLRMKFCLDIIDTEN